MRKTSLRKRLLVGAAALSLTGVGLVIAGSPAYSTVSQDSGFEAADGDLEPNGGTPNFDWNSFATVTWTGDAPYQTANKTTGAWEFDGLEDAQNSGADTVFGGGVKQDDDCATVQSGPKPPNKDDLKRAYLSNATIEVDEDPGAGETLADHVFLNLAWVRIPQNTTNASAHVAFEFNQAERDVTASLCDATKPNGLLKRTAGDMLVVYDFAGSSTDTPAIKLLRWLSGTYQPTWNCEVAKSRPCWGNAQILTALVPPVAEAKVNTSDVGPVTDSIAPVPPDTLGQNEFGEAGIDLTAADVFNEGECVSFGSVYAVSRSSGNSGQAQMKDIVGPGDISLNNCGGVIIRKVTDPSPDEADPDTEFGYTTTGGLLDEDGDADKFSLSDGESQDYGTEVQAGAYTVTEDDPSPDYALTDIDCDASDDANGTTIEIDEENRTVSFTLAALDTVDCTFTNTLQRGALRIQKLSTKSDTYVANAGAVFSVDGPDTPEGTDTPDFLVEDNGAADTGTDPDTVADETGDDTSTTEDEEGVGEVCVSGLLPGTYTVDETTAPDGYDNAPEDPIEVTVVTGTDCDENLPDANETGAVATFTNAPLADIQVNFKDGGSGETALVDPAADSITCVDADENATLPTGNNTLTEGWDNTLNVPGIPIDPSPRTIVCTIVIDP